MISWSVYKETILYIRVMLYYKKHFHTQSMEKEQLHSLSFTNPLNLLFYSINNPNVF